MLPPLYQKILLPHLNESQYLTLQLLLLLLQAHRQVKLSVLASVFPQPIQYQSRFPKLTTIFSVTSVVRQTIVVSPD